jgi:hypothetical protein
MLGKIVRNMRKKSLQERFLLVIGILFFIAYLILGLFVIFMNNFPFDMKRSYRVAFGLLLITYAIIRGQRIINDNKR